MIPTNNTYALNWAIQLAAFQVAGLRIDHRGEEADQLHQRVIACFQSGERTGELCQISAWLLEAGSEASDVSHYESELRRWQARCSNADGRRCWPQEQLNTLLRFYGWFHSFYGQFHVRETAPDEALATHWLSQWLDGYCASAEPRAAFWRERFFHARQAIPAEQFRLDAALGLYAEARQYARQHRAASLRQLHIA